VTYQAALAEAGRRLRAEREARGWSRVGMASRLRALGRDDLPSLESLAHMLKEWERGKHGVSERYQGLYAAVFGMSEAELFGGEVSPSTVSLVSAAPDVAVRAGARGRRVPVAPDVVDYLREQLPGHYRAELFLGPHHLIPIVTAQTALIAELVESAPRPVRLGLLDVGTAYAALLGWLHQDAGELVQSARWRDVALDLAHRSGNPHLVSYALSNKAQLATDRRDSTAVIDLAGGALDGQGRLCPKVRILALQHRAHGYSLAGDRASVDRLIDEAAVLGDGDGADDGYPWANAYRRTPHYLEVQRATCYGRIGGRAAADAVRLWDEVLGAMPEAARRDNAVFWVRQAAALAAAPEPERVVEIATVTAGLAAETGSARLVRELLHLPERATGWGDSSHARQLGEIIDGVRALEG
jgi:transcriptional regulator with XRE-family HTH domain